MMIWRQQLERRIMKFRVICSYCEKEYAGKIPKGGDGTLWLPHKHKTWYAHYNDYGIIIEKGKKDCPGNYIEADLID